MKKIIIYVTALLNLLPVYAYASVPWPIGDGWLRPDNSNEFLVDLGVNDIENTVGFEFSKTFDLGANYGFVVLCPELTKPTSGDKDIPHNAMFFTSISDYQSSDINPGYLKLNDYFDVKAEIYIAGGRKAYVPVPFKNESNLTDNYMYRECTARNGVYSVANMSTGSKGKVTFKIRKILINGIKFPHTTVATVSAQLGYNTPTSTIPLASVAISNTVLEVKEKCEIEKGQLTEIDFGEVGSSELDGEHYKKKLSLGVSCSGTPFTSALKSIKLGFQGSSADFNSNYFSTSNDEVGIKVTDNMGAIIEPSKTYPITLDNGEATFESYVAPVADVPDVSKDGEFNSSLIVIASFE